MSLISEAGAGINRHTTIGKRREFKFLQKLLCMTFEALSTSTGSKGYVIRHLRKEEKEQPQHCCFTRGLQLTVSVLPLLRGSQASLQADLHVI